MTDRPSVHRFEDPGAFLARASDYLRAEPVVTSVLATTAEKALRRPAGLGPGTPQWWVTVEVDGRVVGLAMRCAPWSPFPVYLSPMPEEAALALAEDLPADLPVVIDVNGARPAADVVAGHLAQVTGRGVEEAMRLRLFELGQPVDPPDPPGEWRLATRADQDLVAEWLDRFHLEADAQAGRPPDPNPPHFAPGELEARLDEGLFGLWCDAAGRVVHLTGWNAAAQGVVRIGPVFTPAPQRGKGYAAAAVARAGAAAVRAGRRAVLFTDQANPTSNALYVRLGYRAVTDMVNLHLTGP